MTGRVGFPGVQIPRTVDRDTQTALENMLQRLQALESAHTQLAKVTTTVQTLSTTVGGIQTTVSQPPLTFQENFAQFAQGAILNVVPPIGLTLVGSFNAVAQVATYTFTLAGLVLDAPFDGNIYGRRNGAWVVLQSSVQPPAIYIADAYLEAFFDEDGGEDWPWDSQ